MYIILLFIVLAILLMESDWTLSTVRQYAPLNKELKILHQIPYKKPKREGQFWVP